MWDDDLNLSSGPENIDDLHVIKSSRKDNRGACVCVGGGGQIFRKLFHELCSVQSVLLGILYLNIQLFTSDMKKST